MVKLYDVVRIKDTGITGIVVNISSSDEYIQKLDDAVKKARANKEWRAANVQWTFSLQPTGAETEGSNTSFRLF